MASIDGLARRYITQESHKLEIQQVRPPIAVTNAVSWRSEGIRYRKNEVFLDVVESVNLLVSRLERSPFGVVFRLSTDRSMRTEMLCEVRFLELSR